MKNDKERYGNLLNNVMNRKGGKMVSHAKKFTDSILAMKHAEIERRNLIM